MAPAIEDPVFAAIRRHKRLRHIAYKTFGDDEDDNPEYDAACTAEESALQKLSRLKPTTAAGARALLEYMADVEAHFVLATGSPLLRTVLTVVKALKALEARGS